MKRILSLSLAYCLMFTLAGCGSGISEEQYNQVCAERDALLAEIQELKENLPDKGADMVPVTISGTFTATVRGLIPGYQLDNTTLQVAIVTPFQSSPFALYVGDLAEQLEVGEIYVFEVKPKEAEITPQEYERGISFFPEVIERYHLHISGFRIAGEKDYGLETTHLVFEKR